MALRFYNTLTQRVEPFQPLDGMTVRMYTCYRSHQQAGQLPAARQAIVRLLDLVF
jgi:cysteinyl-tRNA synthetase